MEHLLTTELRHDCESTQILPIIQLSHVIMLDVGCDILCDERPNRFWNALFYGNVQNNPLGIMIHRNLKKNATYLLFSCSRPIVATGLGIQNQYPTLPSTFYCQGLHPHPAYTLFNLSPPVIDVVCWRHVYFCLLAWDSTLDDGHAPPLLARFLIQSFSGSFFSESSCFCHWLACRC